MEHIELLVRAEQSVGEIIINRPEVSNAMGDQTIREIADAYQELDANAGVKVIILSGKGRGFCSGHDLAGKSAPKPETVLGDVDLLLSQNFRLLELYEGNTPIIAKVHGYCLGGAVELVLHCDLSVASEPCKFAHPAIRGAGGSPNALIYPFALGFSKAKEYLWVTPELNGIEAAQWNLVNRAVPESELDEFVNTWALRIASMPVDNIRLMRRGLRRLLDRAGFREAVELGADLDAFGHTGPATKRWRAMVAEKGLKEAMRLRDTPFY